MKYFKHDLSAFEDEKVWELVETHGMQGYGIWWWLLEQLYAEEDNGFLISATEVWFKKASKRMNLSDWRTLVRVLDTLCEVKLIDPQLWAEHHIYCPGIIKRADSYISQKAAARERKRKQRQREKEQNQVNCHTDVTRDNADVTRCHAGVTTNTDPDTDPKEEIMSPEGDLSRVTSDKSKKRKDASYYLKKCSEAYRSKFEDWWTWYKSRCEDLGSHYGSKASAAQVWAQMEKGFDIEQFRLGCSTWFKEAKAKGSKAPHGCIFLKGKDTHKDPYWVAALESLKPQQKSDFLATSPVQTLTITPEQEAELRAKDPMELTDEEFALLNPGFKIYGKGAA